MSLLCPPDYHVHSRFSCDGEATVEEICRAAIAQGRAEFALTDHLDFHPPDPCFGHFRPAPYWKAVRRCRSLYQGLLTIRAGIECGEAHIYRQEIAAVLAAHEYDFVLGSLHWVGDRPAFSGDMFDGLSLEEGVTLYWEEMSRLAAAGEYDVLGHLDIIRRASFQRFGLGELDFSPYEPQVRRLLRTVAKRGKGIEVNTAYRRKGIGEPGPSVQVLRWFREEGGEIVTLGSDSHRSDDLGADLDRALALVRAAGFERLAVFKRRQVRWLWLFTEKGG